MSRALHSLSGSGHTYERLFEYDFRRVTVSCILKGGRTVAPRLKPRKVYSSIKPISNRSYSAFSFQPLLRSRYEPMNTINCGLINGGFELFAPYKSAISVRHFSQASRAVLPKNVAGEKEGRKKSASFLAFNKHWKQSKSLTHKKPLLVTNAAKKDAASALKDPLLEDGKKEADVVVPALINNEGQLPKTKAKRKPQPKSKKSLEESTVTSEELTTQTSSKKVSSSKKTKTSKKDVGTPASEVSSNVKPLIEASLEEEQSKGTTKKPRKRKPKTQAKSSTESNEAVQIVDVSELPSKSKPPTIVKNRTIKPLYPPSGKSVVVVESVTKAKVIQGYLGDMFEVLPSYGHVRDLAARSGSVRPDDDFSMVWEVPSAAWTHLKSIKVALNEYDTLSSCKS